MKRLVILLSLVLLGSAASACSPASASEPAAEGTRVSVSGGSYTSVDAQALKQMLDHKNFTLVNVHVPYAGEIAQTDLFIPYDRIEQEASRLPADKQAMIVLYCSSGHMSTIAAQKLAAVGYTNVWNLAGGMAGWTKLGFPLVQK